MAYWILFPQSCVSSGCKIHLLEIFIWENRHNLEEIVLDMQKQSWLTPWFITDYHYIGMISIWVNSQSKGSRRVLSFKKVVVAKLNAINTSADSGMIVFIAAEADYFDIRLSSSADDIDILRLILAYFMTNFRLKCKHPVAPSFGECAALADVWSNPATWAPFRYLDSYRALAVYEICGRR